MEAHIRHINTKIDNIRKIIDRISLLSIDCARYVDELRQVELSFFTSIAHLVRSGSESQKAQNLITFLRTISLDDCVAKIDMVLSRIVADLTCLGVFNKVQKKNAKAVIEIQDIVKLYPRDTVVTKIEQINFAACSNCCGPMTVDTNNSELRCVNFECGMLTEVVGTTFDDTQLFCGDGQKSRSGTFNPNRHFQFWWMHILALEPDEEIGCKSDPENLYGEKLIANLRKIIARDGILLRILTVNDVRGMLRELKQTKLNKNVPLILKKLTGIGPPRLSEEIAVQVENYFNKSIEISEQINREDRINRNYYPFYIFKILDAILKTHEERRVLYYIYIQSKDTVEADDADWEQICESLTGIQYRPTDRHIGTKYRPI